MRALDAWFDRRWREPASCQPGSLTDAHHAIRAQRSAPAAPRRPTTPRRTATPRPSCVLLGGVLLLAVGACLLTLSAWLA